MMAIAICYNGQKAADNLLSQLYLVDRLEDNTKSPLIIIDRRAFSHRIATAWVICKIGLDKFDSQYIFIISTIPRILRIL